MSSMGRSKQRTAVSCGNLARMTLMALLAILIWAFFSFAGSAEVTGGLRKCL
jgi:hypothetical protein